MHLKIFGYIFLSPMSVVLAHFTSDPSHMAKVAKAFDSSAEQPQTPTQKVRRTDGRFLGFFCSLDFGGG